MRVTLYTRLFCAMLIFAGLTNAQFGEASIRAVTLKLELVPSDALSSVTLKATITNGAKPDIGIAVSDPVFDYVLDVKDEKGHAVPYSKPGEQIFSRDRIRSTRMIDVTMTTGEIHADTWPIVELFHFASPGVYHVAVRREFFFRADLIRHWVASNIVEVVMK